MSIGDRLRAAAQALSPRAGTGTLNNGPTLVTGSPLAGQPGKPVAVASYTLALTDAARCVETTSSSATTVTVPTNASAPFPIGTVIPICQYGAGQVTIAGAGGVTLRTARSVTTRAQYATVQLRKRATDEWVLSGDLT